MCDWQFKTQNIFMLLLTDISKVLCIEAHLACGTYELTSVKSVQLTHIGQITVAG